MLNPQADYRQLQNVIDGVLHELYRLPVQMRTIAKVLECLHTRQQEIREDYCKSGCQYIALAQVIDHFLQQVSSHQDPSVWLCDEWEAYDSIMEELFTLHHVVIRKEGNHVCFRKFFVDCNEENILSFYKGAHFCSKHMFSQEPSLIEYVNLTTGEKKTLWSA